MKTKLTLFIAVLFMFCSCDEDLLTYDVDTHLTKSITADITDGGLKTNLYPFQVIDTLNLKDNKDIEDYLDRIKEFEIHDVTCKLNGILDTHEITELNISIEQTGMAVKLTNLTDNNTGITLDVSSTIITAIGEYLLSQNQLIIKIEGKSTYAPMTLTVDLDFNTTVTTKLTE